MACTVADSLLLFKGSYHKPLLKRDIAAHCSPGILNLNRDGLIRKGFRRQINFVTRNKVTVIRAVAIPVQPAPAESADYRKELAENYGFTQIGEHLPEDITLKDVINSLPKKVFEIDDVKAWKSVLISVTSYALGLFMISKAPWYLLPFAWAWTGTAITGVSSIHTFSLMIIPQWYPRSFSIRYLDNFFLLKELGQLLILSFVIVFSFFSIQFFVIGHDCAHKSFSSNKLVEDIVGTLAFMPLIYPYEPWRFKHDRHHAKTNMLSEDTAWHPVLKDEFESSPLLRKAIVYGYGPFRCWMSIAHWLMWHFDLKKFRPNEVPRVKISLACVFAFIAIGWPLIIYKTGIMGWIKFWLMPWLGYHFWVISLLSCNFILCLSSRLPLKVLFLSFCLDG
ncbi:hypothetical protein Fmac_012959 [Flemingia macrophylla]|uniref:Fatty acid desaturase domain-containing protein n=1 Tax=Flemingia macrophylla TaxID=520843 RepID=A0ABD1MRV2_9FABA